MLNSHSLRVVRTLLFLLIFLPLFPLQSCRDKNHATLVSADNIIESRPDSAAILLDEIDINTLNKEDKAYYALLKTQADVKNDVFVSSDSLILLSKKYYQTHGDSRLLMRASFYLAYVYYYINRMNDAMFYVSESLDLANNLNDYYWMAKSAELISLILTKTCNYPLSELYSRKAAEYFNKVGKIENNRFCECDVAVDLINQGKMREALSILDSLSALSDNSPALTLYITQSSIRPLYSTEQYVKQKQQLGLIPEESMRLEDFIFRSHIQGNDSAQAADIDKALRLSQNYSDSIMVHYARFQHQLNHGKYSEAARLGDSLLDMQSVIVRDVLRESAMSARSEYYIEKSYVKQHEATILRIVCTLITAIALLTIASSFIIYRLRLRARRAEFESGLSAMITQRKGDEKIVESLFRKQWHTINMLCNEYFEKGESEKTRSSIINSIEKELSKLREPKNLKQIESAVDSYMGNIISVLRSECDFLKEDDFRFLSLIYAGLSVRAVCLIMGIKYKNYYLKKSRLVKRIAESSSPSKELILSKLA